EGYAATVSRKCGIRDIDWLLK
ncbi:hypothetical protein EVA_21835, partial [gut metagenome]